MTDKLIVIVDPPNMDIRRCYDCGRWWAYEIFSVGSAECPICAGAYLVRLRETIGGLQRKVRALKGALKRKSAS